MAIIICFDDVQLKQKYYKEVSKEVRTPMNGTRLSYFSMNI